MGEYICYLLAGAHTLYILCGACIKLSNKLDHIYLVEGYMDVVGLSKNGELIALISEERITRKKNFAGFPSESLRYLKSKYLNNDFSIVDRFIFVRLMFVLKSSEFIC